VKHSTPIDNRWHLHDCTIRFEYLSSINTFSASLYLVGLSLDSIYLLYPQGHLLVLCISLIFFIKFESLLLFIFILIIVIDVKYDSLLNITAAELIVTLPWCSTTRPNSWRGINRLISDCSLFF